MPGRRGGLDEVSGEDIERLASRVALLVSDDGEADNAGRAVGQLARRLGLSGGDLKQIVLAGAGSGFRPGTNPAVARLEQQVAALQQELRSARQDRDVLLAENGAMRVAVYRGRAATRMRRLLVMLGVLGLVLVGAGVAWLGPDIAATTPRDPGVAALARAAQGGRLAVVRSAGATVRIAPDAAAEAVRALPAGTRLVVVDTKWNNLLPWAVVEVDGRPGYVAPTELEMY